MKHLNTEWLCWGLSKSCGYRDGRRKGLKLQSWQSGAFLKAPLAPWLSAHTSDVSTRHELLARTAHHFVQCSGSVPELVPKWWLLCRSDSFIPALPQAPDERWTNQIRHALYYCAADITVGSPRMAQSWELYSVGCILPHPTLSLLVPRKRGGLLIRSVTTP